MINFKRFLGTLLIGTVLWLLWILGTQLGVIKDQPSSPKHQASQITWQNYSPELIQQLRGQNRMIFIDFTAKWCLSCQVNEKIALDNPEVIKKFKELNIAMVKADWTSQNVNITEALAEFGKNSIPLYVLYGKDPTADAIILPEIITPKAVLAILDKINR
jgi:thiol:disulfide interchange protein DsbD